MAVTYGFYNALNHDRLYDAIQMSSIFDGIIRDGIFSTIGDTMIVTAPEDGMYVNVGSGRAWFNHTWTLNDTAYPIEAEEAEVVLDRIDAVILEVNSSAEVRANSIKFLKGTPSSNPVKPTLTHNAEVNQYALAYVRIRAGQTTIFQSDIENVVGTDETPFITGVLQQVSIETLLKQWEAEFNTYFTNFQNTSTTEFNNWFATKVSEYTAWFAQMQTDMDSNFNEFDAWFQNIKDQLDENQAGHLQLQIDTLNSDINALEAEMPFAGGSKVNINFEYDVIPNIQYSNEHYKLTVGDTVRENNFSSSQLHFNEYGILTVGDGVLEVTYDITDSRTGKITHASYTYTINMPYFGRFAYNVTISASLYNYQGWLESIGKDPSQYSTIEDVFADEKLLRELMTRHTSVDYLVEWLANKNEDAHTVLNNDYCAKWINLRDYALDMLYANPTVKAVMDEVDKYGYGEWALVGQVPKMTSNTAPIGRVIFSNNLINSSQAYWAFDGNETDSSRWHASKQDGTYIGYEFDEPKIIHAFRINADHSTTLGAYIKTFVIKGRNTDSESWVDLTDIITANDSKTSNVVTVGKMNSNGIAYKQIAVFPLSSYADEYRLYEVQFYTWGPKGNVPVMTSNTAPYGVASAQDQYDSSTPAYKAFDGDDTGYGWNASGKLGVGKTATKWIQYRFNNPIMVRKVTFLPRTGNGVYPWQAVKIQGSNDGSSWTDLYSDTTVRSEQKTYELEIPNDTYYMYVRMMLTVKNSHTTDARAISLLTLQFYGRQLNVSVPTMTSNTAPFGELLHGGEESAEFAVWKAFDKNNSSRSSQYPSLDGNSGIGYYGYDFGSDAVVKFVTEYSTNTNELATGLKYYLEGSSDKNTWTKVREFTSNAHGSNAYSDVNSNNQAFRYWRMAAYSGGGNGRARNSTCLFYNELQFYGLDYSEREFAEGSTMKYLYDHGVELMEVTEHIDKNGTVTKLNDNLLAELKNQIGVGQFYTYTDLTNYSVVYAKVDLVFVDLLIMQVRKSVPITTDTWSVSNSLASNSITTPLPSTKSLIDISSINGNAYVILATGGSTSPVNRSFSVSELWLE